MNQPPKVGLFCKTFKPDLAWLYFALNSFVQNWIDQTEILLVAEPDCQAEIERWNIPRLRTVYVEPWPCGYCHAMATKLCADRFLPECDLILLFDSDMMLIKPSNLSDLLGPDGHPTVVYDLWNSDLDRPTRQVSRQVWVPAVQRSMGIELDRDFMVSPCWLFWSSTFSGARLLIETYRKMPFWQSVYCREKYDWTHFTEHPFKLCDMQALGVYAYGSELYKYGFEQRSSLANQGPIRQSWSHSIDGPRQI